MQGESCLLGKTGFSRRRSMHTKLHFQRNLVYSPRMCVTFFESKLSDTILYAAETERGGRRVHVMAYQNRAQNLAKGPNAMLLPIPAAAPLSADNTLDMRIYSGILGDYVATYGHYQPSRIRWANTSLYKTGAAEAQVFDSGSYTVVLAKDARVIPAALARVPENRRPAPNRAIFSAYARYYPGWHMALCCYDGAIEAEPLVFWYEPLFPDRLFAPALDAHDGNPPDLGAKVWRDHYVFFASLRAKRGMVLRKKQTHSALLANIRPLFLERFAGTDLRDLGANGDFWLDIKDLDSETIGFETLPPPGA